MKKFILHLFFIFSLLNSNVFSQTFGETKKRKLVVLKEIEAQVGGWVFKDLKTNEVVEVANFEFLPLTSGGISFYSLGNYIGQKFDVDFKYLLHLCNEGIRDNKCEGWVITSISKPGVKLVEDLKKIPFIGYLEDKDGYVNVRKSMSAKSAIVGRLTSNDEVLRYYYKTNDDNWLQVIGVYDENNSEGKTISGYIHKSRVKIINQ